MGVAIAIAFALASLVVGVGLISNGSLGSIDNLADSRKHEEVRKGDQSRTALSLTTSSEASPLVNFTVKNSGQRAIADFPSWDVVVKYYDTGDQYQVAWLPYTTAASPGDNQWTVTGIYVNALTLSTEIYQPNILDPEEEVIIQVRLNPAAKDPASNVAVISTPNGVPLNTSF